VTRSLDPPLPTFKIYPDPIATGVIEPSDTICRACDVARGYIYTGPVSASEKLYDALCPWCIADGTARATFDAQFADHVGNETDFDWDPVPPTVRDEVLHRTPGYVPWQFTQWWTHCGDATAFLGYADYEEPAGSWSVVVSVIRQEAVLGPDDRTSSGLPPGTWVDSVADP
jgi:uncharacterized protein CbrC (UPF0167 family)